ncbi:hypothetical protein F5Y09DRAFT_343016 [Xylaria sp. FL1042]|nr:hypothetical protein F5Y09DRAFT_343016 [Xylaria sp. FL1042]
MRCSHGLWLRLLVTASGTGSASHRIASHRLASPSTEFFAITRRHWSRRQGTCASAMPLLDVRRGIDLSHVLDIQYAAGQYSRHCEILA